MAGPGLCVCVCVCVCSLVRSADTDRQSLQVITHVITPLNSVSVNQDVAQERELRTHLSREEIRQKVELYNNSSKDHLKMTLVSDL